MDPGSSYVYGFSFGQLLPVGLVVFWSFHWVPTFCTGLDGNRRGMDLWRVGDWSLAWIQVVLVFTTTFKYLTWFFCNCHILQGWAGMTFGSSGTGTGMDNSIPEVREREGNWKNPFPQFGNGKGMKKNHSQNSGMGREWKNLFPKFGNGKGMKKIHSRNSGTGIRGYYSREWTGTGMERKNYDD